MIIRYFWLAFLQIQLLGHQIYTFSNFIYLFVFKYFINVYFIFERKRERNRDRPRMEEGQRERETQNPKQSPDSELSAQSQCRARTHKLWHYDLSQSWTLNQLSHLGAPDVFYFHLLSCNLWFLFWFLGWHIHFLVVSY